MLNFIRQKIDNILRRPMVRYYVILNEMPVFLGVYTSKYLALHTNPYFEELFTEQELEDLEDD